MSTIQASTYGPLRAVTLNTDRAMSVAIISGASDDELRGAQAIFQHWADLMRFEMDRRADRAKGVAS